MPFEQETEGGWEYQFSFYDPAWEEDNMGGLVVTPLILSDGGVRTEAQMDAIAQQVCDFLATSPFPVANFYKASKLNGAITPTPPE